MAIGIMSAMHEEIHLISANITGKRIETIGNREYVIGHLEGVAVVAVFSRWGKVAAAQTATTLISRFGVEKVIFTGVAGAADPSLEIGDVVIGESLVQHDMDASAIPAFSRFEIPLLGITHFQADHRMHRLAVEASRQYLSSVRSSDIPVAVLEDYGIHNPNVVSGTIATGDQFIANNKTISELRALIPSLSCIEMEGAAVAQVCHEHLIPFIVIRAISDKADANAMRDFPGFVKNIVSHYSLGIVTILLKNLYYSSIV